MGVNTSKKPKDPEAPSTEPSFGKPKVRPMGVPRSLINIMSVIKKKIDRDVVIRNE
jgi:hypothetical protein